MKKLKPFQGGLLFIMKVTVIQIFIAITTVAMAYAIDSSGQRVLDKKVNIDVKDLEFDQVLIILKEQAKVRFTYSPKLVDAEKKVTLHYEDTKLLDVLNSLLGSGVSYSVIGKQIILRPADTMADEASLSSEASANTEVSVKIEGTVTDDSGAGLPGVNIIEKGTANGTTTDVDGHYVISVADNNSILVFTFIGYTTQEISVDARSSINISLLPDVSTLDEVVVVGYGEQKKVTVTGSVVAVNGADLVKSPAIDLTNSIAGRMPGVSAVQSSGEPGYDGSVISIRGTNTLGNSGALVVIDGIPDRDGGIGRLSPQDIESISVLKDASSAIYGARAANGVILVTTKRGKAGAPQIIYDFNLGWAQPTRIPKMSNAPEYAGIMNEIPIYKTFPSNEWPQAWQSIQTTGTFTSPTNGATVNANYSPSDVQKFKDGSDPWGHPNTDWFGDAFKTWSPQSRHNLVISGGNDDIKYFASLGYLNQDAYYNNSATFYKQYSMRLNMDARINKYINSSLGLMVREESRNFPTESAGEIFRMLMRGRPTEPEIWPNGKPGPDIENGQNPIVVTTNQTGYLKNPTDYIQANGKVDITNPWIEGLKLTLMGSVDKSNSNNKMWETPWYLYTWDKITFEPDGTTPSLVRALRSPFSDPRLTQSQNTVLNTNLSALLAYEKTFGEHNLNLLLGVTKETFEGDNYLAYRRFFISPAIDQMFAGGTAQQNTNGGAYNRARLGYYGRATYNYKEKYLAEFLFRYDGSDAFPEDQRFGFFPGVSLGWNISNENFFHDNVGFVDFLKLRGSYGEMGNDQIYLNGNRIEYGYLAAYQFGNYPINSAVATTLYEGLVPNPNFTWERAKNLNFGLDGTFLQGKIDLTLEYFYNKRDQILIDNQGVTPGSAGLNGKLPPVNAGKLENKGFEFKIGYSGKVSDVKYTIGVNGGYAKNEIIVTSENKSRPSYQWQQGKPLGALLVYQSDGVFLNQEEIDSETIDYSGVTSQLRPGDMKFKDVDGNLKIDGDDQVRSDKNNTPTFNYGISMNVQWKSFDLSILFQGATGSVLQFGTESGDIGNYLKYSHDNRWSIDRPSSTDPRLASRGDTYYTGQGYGNNTYFLFNKNYLRLKNIELGYTVPAKLGKKVGLNSLRIFVNALNLITWDKFKIWDPESVSGSGQYYPQARVINTGLRLTF